MIIRLFEAALEGGGGVRHTMGGAREREVGIGYGTNNRGNKSLSILDYFFAKNISLLIMKIHNY